jgi:asparagine synthetase B (glutamine-hydrolysing)
MDHLFGLFGPAAKEHFDALSSYYKNKNNTYISLCYESFQHHNHGLFIAQTGAVSDNQKRLNEAPFGCLSDEPMHDNGAPQVCSFALQPPSLTAQLRHLSRDFDEIKLQNIEQDFLFIMHDQKTRAVRFAASPFNPRTLFYANISGTWLISDDLTMFREFIPPKVDTHSLAMWLSGRPDPNRSMFTNIHQLPFSHCAEITDGSACKLKRFWDINPNLHVKFDGQQEYQHKLREALLQSIDLSLLPSWDQPVFSQMSGGMDSTSITALLHQNSIDLHTLSHTYKQTQSCDEMDKISAMQQKLRLTKSHFIELDRFGDIPFSQLYPTSLQNPGVVNSPKYHQEAQLIQQHGGKLLFTGNGGDEMCWGHSLAYRDRLIGGDVSVISEVVRSARQLNYSVISALKHTLVKPMLPALLQRLLNIAAPMTHDTPKWLNNEYARWLREHKPHNPFSDSAQWAKRARYEGLMQTSTFNSMRSYQLVCDQYGINVKHPFFNKSVAEFSFAIPEKLHLNGAYPKHLLRHTMSDLLPESVCWETSKTVFDKHFANLVRSNGNELRSLLSHTGLQDLGLIDNSVLLAHFEQVVQDPNSSLNVDLLYAILTQSWYQTHIEHT